MPHLCNRSVSVIRHGFNENRDPTWTVSLVSQRYKLYTIISTGGGLLVDAENMDTMKKYAMVFCLWASPESIWRRVKGQSHRPLLNTDNPKQRIIDLLEERKPGYSRSDMLINTEYRSARDVANLILSQFLQATRKEI